MGDSPFCAGLPPGAVCRSFSVSAPDGNVIDAVVDAKAGDAVNSINKFEITGIGGTVSTLKPTPSPQGLGGFAATVPSCQGGYAGFNYWADIDENGDEVTIRGLQFLCRTESGLHGEAVLGKTGGLTGPTIRTEGRTGVLCPTGSSLTAFSGNYFTFGTEGPTGLGGWWWNIDQDSLDQASACGTFSPTGTTGTTGATGSTGGLSNAEMVAIVIGIIVAFILIVLIIYFATRHNHGPSPNVYHYYPAG